MLFFAFIQTLTLEKEAYPALDELTSKISTLNLERVRQIKSRLVALSGRVQKVLYWLDYLESIKIHVTFLLPICGKLSFLRCIFQYHFLDAISFTTWDVCFTLTLERHTFLGAFLFSFIWFRCLAWMLSSFVFFWIIEHFSFLLDFNYVYYLLYTQVRDELEHLLDDDMDMAEMYLTDKLAHQRAGESSSRINLENDASEQEDGWVIVGFFRIQQIEWKL